MVEKFKSKLRSNGQNLKWFFDTFIKNRHDISLTYSGFTAQLNGYAPISENVEKEIMIYMER